MTSRFVRVLYVSNLDGQAAIGYDSKIVGQARGLVRPDISCELISFDEDRNIVLRKIGLSGEERESRQQLYPGSSNLLIRRQRLLRATFDKLNGDRIDILYFRYPRADPLYLYYLFRYKLAFPELKVFCEYPTFPYDQESMGDDSLKASMIRYLDRISRGYLKHVISSAIAVNYSGQIYGIPAISIANGITVKEFRLRSPVPIKGDVTSITLLGVANVQEWHGYDRVIEGLGVYYREHQAPIEVNFHIVGIREPMRSRLLKVISDFEIERYVSFSPPVHGQSLDELFDCADVAVSTLAAHRIDLHELSPLKSREYCARGIPFILGYSDPDFGADFEYALRVPANDEPVSLSKVIDFALDLRQNSRHPHEMRQYAESQLDWSIKMQPVVNAIRSTLS